MIQFEHLPFSPQLVQARWVLDKFPSEDAPGLAQVALEKGYDGRNIRRIAGLVRPVRGDLLSLMPGFLSELGASNVLSREEAAWTLIRQIAKGITESQITPYEGARFIAYEIVNVVWPNQQHPLRVFIGLASDHEDCAAYPDGVNQREIQIEEDIISEAREILK